MGKSNTEQLQIAAKYLGQGGARFRKFCGLPSGAAWCDAYVSYIFNEAGNASLFCGGKKQTYCPSTIKILQKELAQVPLYLAMPSDVILFDWDRNGVPNHIGFVRSRVSTSTINTIEGNTSNKVMYKTRPAKYVCGIFRPHFNGSYKIGTIAVDGDMGYTTIANLQKALGGIAVDGTLGLKTVKRIQAYFGCSQDGSWGAKTSKTIQGKLAKEGYYTGKLDGEFGPSSVKGLQKWVNAKNKATPAPTPKPTPAPKPAKSTYTGSFPTIPAAKIIDCTRSVNGMRKHGLLSGDYILRFKNEERRYKMCKFSLATVSNKKITYSDRPQFKKKVQTFGYNLAKVKALKTSANCSNFIDGAVGAVTGKYVSDKGAKYNKAALAKTNYFNSLKYSKSALLAGDICGTSKHTWMIIQGAYLSVGCEGAEVKKLQSFLNWAGFTCGTADGDFGINTANAVKRFQSKVGITPDGIVGNGTITKMRAYTK